MDTLNELLEGETATIENIEQNTLSHRLLELGCLPGTTIQLIKKSFFGGPILIEVNHSTLLSIGLKESESLELRRTE